MIENAIITLRLLPGIDKDRAGMLLSKNKIARWHLNEE
jgi:hypothetical protein